MVLAHDQFYNLSSIIYLSRGIHIMAAASLTIDDLSNKLRQVRYKRWLDKEVPFEHRKKMPKTRYPKRDDVASSLEYVNRRFCIGIDYLGFDHLNEDARACILYDLANVPLDMVVSRLRTEGATIE